jgi:CubicO group peptidase (beta-lactamase class C family)
MMLHPSKRGMMMACAFVLSADCAAAQGGGGPTMADAQSADLAGLWKAKRRFGPDEQGPLIVERARDGYVADMAGRRVPMRAGGDELSFELPGGRGRFSGRLEGGEIRGHWIRPGMPSNNGRYASPVRLSPAGRGRWAGTVDTLPDEFTFYLWLQPRPDGSFDAVLRNPDRDVGTQLGVRRLVFEGDLVRLMAARGERPESELARGRYDPESRSFALFVPNRGGTFDFVRDGGESEFYPRGLNPVRYAYRPPPPREDAWATASLEDGRIDRAAIEALVQRLAETSMDSTDAPQIHALLIARHGRLVLEEYFHGYGRDRLHDTRSAAKSLTAITIGAAIQAGAPLGLSSPVYEVMNDGRFPEGIDPQKRAMTLEHLLTMSSGYHCDDTDDKAPGNEEVIADQTEEPDWLRYTLRVPLVTAPGENSVYCSTSPNLALGMLGRATGESPVRTFDRLVARPMKIDRYAWGLDPLDRPYGGGGVQLLPRDFLKMGQLILNGGRWAGRRILDPGFAAAASSPQYHLRNVRYGYLWWVEDLPYKDRSVRSFSARGAGGNLVWVVPELDLVVATMAGNYFSRTQLTYTGPLVARSILPAVREPGDDPRAPVVERDFTSPYGRSTDGSRVAGPR